MLRSSLLFVAALAASASLLSQTASAQYGRDSYGRPQGFAPSYGQPSYQIPTYDPSPSVGYTTGRASLNDYPPATNSSGIDHSSHQNCRDGFCGTTNGRPNRSCRDCKPGDCENGRCLPSCRGACNTRAGRCTDCVDGKCATGTCSPDCRERGDCTDNCCRPRARSFETVPASGFDGNAPRYAPRSNTFNPSYNAPQQPSYGPSTYNDFSGGAASSPSPWRR